MGQQYLTFFLQNITFDLPISLINKTQNPVIRWEKKVTDFHIFHVDTQNHQTCLNLNMSVIKKMIFTYFSSGLSPDKI